MTGSILDKDYDAIVDLIKAGVPKIQIAKRYDVNPGTLHYWLNTRGLRETKEEKEQQAKRKHFAEDIAEQVVNRIAGEVYHICAQEMEKLEHSGEWMGNGHHAGQNMQADIMKYATPRIKNIVRSMVLR